MITRLSVVAVLVFAVGLFGAVGPLFATPDDSQRLRGLGGRTFEANRRMFSFALENVRAFLVDGKPLQCKISKQGDPK